MALRRISQLDPVLHSKDGLPPESPSEVLSIKLQEESTFDEQIRWFVKNNPLLSGYLMEVSEWNGIKANAPSYYLSKQFDLSTLIAIISASITGSMDDMELFSNFHRDWKNGVATEKQLSTSTHYQNLMYRRTYYYGENSFENNVRFHRGVVIEGDRLYHEGLLSGQMTTSKRARDIINPEDDYNNGAKLCVHVPSKFLYPINACSMSAWWADLAEVYDSDGWYSPGTLVQFGGNREITIATTEVNAVVTDNPGFILNTTEHSDFKCPIGIALTGRTPVLVSGKVKKFDRITLSKDNPGIGCVINDTSQTAIAVALESNDDPEIKLVTCSTKFTF